MGVSQNFGDTGRGKNMPVVTLILTWKYMGIWWNLGDITAIHPRPQAILWLPTAQDLLVLDHDPGLGGSFVTGTLILHQTQVFFSVNYRGWRAKFPTGIAMGWVWEIWFRHTYGKHWKTIETKCSVRMGLDMFFVRYVFFPNTAMSGCNPSTIST